ncbi:NADH-quinone oxidoreductase subunit NuoK [Natranaeroarchaeum aerophilus]|uniref:NADH-quinone oxidoreductase subunit NuoK n=1 Tax=Natranaeroarchaeum aerophilus TaxID=2917711 RepID=A0AAE3FTM3_9EURY|nr:NADH-quinone oxidoreductase subunit NuoK [Natranaeroarchaeum aerophilus]MCL9815108.1 NADH-quinone oxidoreductase subunit NuoK [Natranaeroarchaeum aerophilus]
MTVPIEFYLLLSAGMFCIGLFGVLTRRNAIMFLISVELMLNAANINLIAFSFFYGNVTGQVFALFTIGLAAAEVAIGIGIILVLVRNYGDLDVENATTMRW